MNQNTESFWVKIILVIATVIITLVIREIYGYFKKKYFGKRAKVLIDVIHVNQIEIGSLFNETMELTFKMGINLRNISDMAVYKLCFIFPDGKNLFEIKSLKKSQETLNAGEDNRIECINKLRIPKSEFDKVNHDETIKLHKFNPLRKNLVFALQYIDKDNKYLYTQYKDGQSKFLRKKPNKYG